MEMKTVVTMQLTTPQQKRTQRQFGFEDVTNWVGESIKQSPKIYLRRIRQLLPPAFPAKLFMDLLIAPLSSQSIVNSSGHLCMK